MTGIQLNRPARAGTHEGRSRFLRTALTVATVASLAGATLTAATPAKAASRTTTAATTGAATGTAAPGTAVVRAARHASGALAPLLGPDSRAVPSTIASAVEGRSSIVPGSYIVVLKNAAGLRAAGLRAASAPAQVSAAATRGARLGGSVRHTYSGALQGYSATLPGSALAAVRADPAVRYVQQNVRYRLAGQTQKNPGSWGEDRIDQRNLPLSTSYFTSATGDGVNAYVVDTGILGKHPDYDGRVRAGVDEVGSTDGRSDCNGHGTHVAGTLGGTFFGVAKRVNLIPVRVLDCSGGGTQDDILAGLDWVRTHAVHPAVANLSIETTDGSFDTTLNQAVQSLIDAGVTVVTAAGNGDVRGGDACTVSPASARDAITVAASTITDRAASFSNYGKCVDLYAPGQDITSDWNIVKGGQYTIQTLDGTSMASPHVAGVVALYLQRHPSATPAQVSTAIMAMATPDKITGVNPKYPHDLLFSLETAAVPTAVSGGSQLLSGQSLVPGTRLYSANKAFFLADRSRDGWLCLYDAATGTVVWSSKQTAAWTTMASSGALLSYDVYGRKTWQNAAPVGAATMTVNGKGYLAVRRTSDGAVVWTSAH